MLITATKTALTSKVCKFIEKASEAYDDDKARSGKIYMTKARNEWNKDFGPRVSNMSFDGFADAYVSTL